MLIVAVLAAELIVGGLPPLYIVALSLITPIFVSAGAFAINDYFDVDADRANRRMNRPIVAGAISKRGAYQVAVVSFVIGVLASAFINVYALAIAFIFAVLGYLYSYRLKDMVLWGNAYVALAMVIPFIYGDFVVSASLAPVIIWISFIIFLSGLGREIHGAIRDREGDTKARKTKNLITAIGAQKSALFAFTLYCEAIAISVVLFFISPPFQYNLVYIVPITVANIMFFYVAIGYLRNSTRKFYDLARNLSLGAMALALITYLACAVLVPVLV